MLIMVVTVLVSPYAWTTDEIVLLPSVLFALSCPEKPKFALPALLVLNGVELLMIAAQVQFTSGAYIWTTAAWLGWYLYSTHGRRKRLEAPPPQAQSWDLRRT